MIFFCVWLFFFFFFTNKALSSKVAMSASIHELPSGS